MEIPSVFLLYWFSTVIFQFYWLASAYLCFHGQFSVFIGWNECIAVPICRLSSAIRFISDIWLETGSLIFASVLPSTCYAVFCLLESVAAWTGIWFVFAVPRNNRFLFDCTSSLALCLLESRGGSIRWHSPFSLCSSGILLSFWAPWINRILADDLHFYLLKNGESDWEMGSAPHSGWRIGRTNFAWHDCCWFFWEFSCLYSNGALVPVIIDACISLGFWLVFFGLSLGSLACDAFGCAFSFVVWFAGKNGNGRLVARIWRSKNGEPEWIIYWLVSKLFFVCMQRAVGLYSSLTSAFDPAGA